MASKLADIFSWHLPLERWDPKITKETDTKSVCLKLLLWAAKETQIDGARSSQVHWKFE